MQYILLKLEIAVTFVTKDSSFMEIVFNGVIFQTQKSYVVTIKIANNFVLCFLVIYWKTKKVLAMKK